MRVLLALVLAGVPVSLAATTLVVFRVDGRVILATDSAAVRLDEKGRDHITVGCKIRQSGKWWLLNGGYFAPDVVADRIAAASTLADALAALHHSDLRDRVIANKDLWSRRPAGSPLTTVVIAGPDLTLGVFMISLKTVTPFEAIAESDTCPGRLCPTDGYYLVGEPGDAPQNPLLKALPWFRQGDAAAARRFINEQIAVTHNSRGHRSMCWRLRQRVHDGLGVRRAQCARCK